MAGSPSYLELHARGELAGRAAAAAERLRSCDLCPRRCGADRLAGERGYCRAPARARIASAGPHFGEEPPLVGRGGSGTIFFAFCSLGCVFCQNYEISHLARGREASPRELAAVMLNLQRLGCRNINLVTPTHVLPAILEALPWAADGGLETPLVWNCGGYESVGALRLLEGIVDIYMPDFKFALTEPAARYCNAPDYPQAAMDALREMQRQVGDLVLDARGDARRGILIRHLVMPGQGENTRRVLEFIARELSAGAYVNIMDQYRPAWEASRCPEIDRRPTVEEYRAALVYARELGLRRGFGGEER